MVRLFAALLPPATALAQLETAVRPLRTLPGTDRLRWADPASWHLTLAFYGEVAREARPALEARLFRAARRHPVFPLGLAGGGHFGDRTLWVGVSGARHTLRRLAGAAAAAGRREGLGGAQARDFRPHLTLARARGRGRAEVDLRPFVRALASFAGDTWEVTELTLIRSRPPTSGTPGERPRYERIAAWPLVDRRDGG